MDNRSNTTTGGPLPTAPMGSTAGASLGAYMPKKKELPFEVLDPGHRYAVKSTEGGDNIEVVFLKKVVGANSDGKLVVGHDGLTNEALIAVLISRLHFLQSMSACYENEEAIGGLKVALNALERRTRDRQIRGVEGTREA